MNIMPKQPLVQPEYSGAAKKALSRAPSLFINGEWIESKSGRTIDVIDPSTGKVVSKIADATDQEVDRAVAAAREAFDDGRWTGLPPIARELMIHKLADLISQHAEELAELEAIDNGKPATTATALDIPASAGMLHYMAGWATKLGGQVMDPMAAPSMPIRAASLSGSPHRSCRGISRC